MIIAAEMYGMMFSAKIVMRPSAPPENMLKMSSTPPWVCWKISFRIPGSIPGTGM